MARPSVYDEQIAPYLKQIATLRENGFSHEDIAKALKVNERTYYRHKAQIEEFCQSIKNGDEELVKQGKISLLKLMTGYEKKKVVKQYRYENGKKVLVGETETIEQVGPEPSSVYFGLVNKSNGEFKHKQEVVIDDSNDEIAPSFYEALREKYETNTKPQ